MFVTKACMCSQFTPFPLQRAGVSIQTAPFARAARPPRRSHIIWRTRSIVRSRETHAGSSQVWRQGFLRNTRRRTFQPSRARHSPRKRLSNQCATSYTVSVERHCISSVTRQSAGPLALVPKHFSSRPQNLVHRDRHPTPL